jgi:dCMP deaminase
MKDKFINAYMDVAFRFAELSTAKKMKVGSIVVKSDRIISIGYNGTPSGWDNNCEIETDSMEDNPWHDYVALTESGWTFSQGKYSKLKTKPEVMHAEANAITKLAKSSESGEGATLFITHAPCMNCAKLIYQSGISEVYYSHDYRDDSGINFLKKSSISIKKISKKS